MGWGLVRYTARDHPLSGALTVGRWFHLGESGARTGVRSFQSSVIWRMASRSRPWAAWWCWTDSRRRSAVQARKTGALRSLLKKIPPPSSSLGGSARNLLFDKEIVTADHEFDDFVPPFGEKRSFLLAEFMISGNFIARRSSGVHRLLPVIPLFYSSDSRNMIVVQREAVFPSNNVVKRLSKPPLLLSTQTNP
jgi:hypothetical protein